MTDLDLDDYVALERVRHVVSNVVYLALVEPVTQSLVQVAHRVVFVFEVKLVKALCELSGYRHGC